MHIKTNSENRIVEVIVQEGLHPSVYEGSNQVVLPSDFYQNEINDWKYLDGVFSLDPIPREETLSEMDKLKQELAELRALVSA